MGKQVAGVINHQLEVAESVNRSMTNQVERSRKRILLHLHTPPIPTDGGDKRRLLGMLQYFRDRQSFFSVDVVAHNRRGYAPWTPDARQAVLEFVDRIFVYEGERNLGDFVYSRSQSFFYQTLLRQQLPIDSDYFTPPGFIKFVQSQMAQQSYDYVWINYLEYAHLATRSKLPNTCLLIDIHDIACEGRLARKNVYPLKGKRFDYEANFSREVTLLNQFDGVLVNSQQEMTTLQSHIRNEKLYFVPHLVENVTSREVQPYSQRQFDYDLLFVGTGLGPNVEGLTFFLNHVFPIIVHEKPDVRFAIAGTVSDYVQINPALAPNISCLGFVADLSAVYLASRIVICPLLNGAGTKVKLQEAMAYAVPIVTTTTGASGMQLLDGVNAFITNEPEQYAYRILQLLREPEFAQMFSQQIHTTFQQQYSNSSVYATLDRLFRVPAQ